MFSVIITCYNEGEELIRAVRSVQAQTFRDYDIVVVKDFSNHQPTIDACKQLEQEGIRVLYADSNVGVSVTRNMGIAATTGEYVYTMDGDDELPCDALQIAADTFDQHPEAGVVFGDYLLIDQWEQRIECKELCDGNGYLSLAKLLKNNRLYGQSPIRRSVLEQIRGFSQKYSFGCQDFEMQLRMLIAGVKFVYTPHVLYRWYKKPSGINSSQRNRESLDECFYEHLEFCAAYLKPQYVLQLCKQHDDRSAFRQYFRIYSPWYLSFFSCIMPWSMLKRMGRIFINK